MKILLIAGFFPPFAPSAATRAPKLAKYLLDRGHDVRVLAPANTKFPPLLQAGIPEDRITYTKFTDRSRIPERFLSRFGRTRGAAGKVLPEMTQNTAPLDDTPTWRRKIGAIYRKIVETPDPSRGWYPHAMSEGRALIASWQPDILYASAPPHTGLLVASALSRQSGVPWVAELRDLWVHHPYYAAPGWRRPYERLIEWRALSNVSGFVTVTQTWRDLLERLHGKRTVLAMNGFDPDEFLSPPIASAQVGDTLNIVYAGSLYKEKRDPSVLFDALKQMGNEGAAIRADFYVPDGEFLESLVAQAGLQQIVKVHAPVPREEIIAIEQAADILLLLRWDHPSEHGVIAGKLFEYIGAGRPILSVGATGGEAADIIRDNGFGCVTNDVGEIVGVLQSWLARKRGGEPVPPESWANRDSFTRARQFEAVEKLLGEIVQTSLQQS